MTTTALTSKNYHYFICATRHLVKHGGVNGGKLLQKDFADALGCSPEHLSGILSAKQTRKASLGLQEKIAAYFDMHLASFLEMGRALDEGETNPKIPVSDLTRSRAVETTHQNNDPVDIVSQVSKLVNKLSDTESEVHRLNAIVESLDIGITIIDNDEIIVYQNSKSREIFGQSYVGKSYRDILENTVIKFVDGKNNSAIERCFETRVTENSIWWSGDKCVSSTASILQNNSGEFAGIACTAKDITFRQRLIENNNIRISRLEEAMDLLENGVLILDQLRNVTFTNAKYRHINGMTGDEKTVDDIVRCQREIGLVNLDEIRSSMFNAYSEQKETSVVCFRESGDRLLYSFKPIFNHDGAFVGMFSFISPHHQRDHKITSYFQI